MKKLLFLLLSLSVFNAQSQIVVDNTSPYDDPNWLVDSVLILDGVVASNILFQGDSSQIGFFNAINTPLGIDSGIVLCTGDVNDLDPASPPTFPFISNVVVDPDLLAVANSVPGLIGQTFSVSSVNDIAILEFDFIAISESFSFRYAFGSQEYFAFENTQYNDVFGFFLSGPGIAGPWSNNAINLAIVPNSNPPLPITISSVNSVTPINQQYFVDNQGGLNIIADADGYTTILTTNPVQVQCGETYHIKLAIADGTDGGLSSYVWLESGSFDAPPPPPPEIKCIWETNDSIYFDWEHPVGASSTTDYYIMGSSTLGGNYTFLASVDYPNSLHPIAVNSIPSNIEYFYIKIPSSCADGVIASDTLTSILFNTNTYNVSCWDDSDGRIVVDMQSNVIVPFTYILDSVANTNPYPGDSVFDGLSAGTYQLIITDSASCFIEEVVHITAPGTPLQALTVDSSSTCHQDSLGFASVVAVGGSSPYSYEWHSSNGSLVSTDDTASSLLGGLYFVEVTDVNGCDTVGSVNLLTPNTAIFSSTEIGEVICKGDPSGYIVGDAGGGFAPYTYTWSTSLGGVIQTTSGSYNTDTLHSVSSGIYLLDIVDHYGCSVSQSSLTVNEPLTALSIDTLYLIDSVYCYGDNDGRSLAVVSGGDPSYVYSWDNGESTLLATSLTGGYHIFSVVDERGCEVFDSIYIPESSEIISTLLVEESVECYGSTNGIVSVSTYGGYADYIYSWSNGQPLDTGFVDTAYNLSYGVYALTTEDSLGCSVVDSIFMYEPDLLTMESHEVSWISCFGADDGLASSSAQGGTEPYTFVWDNNQIGDTVNTLTPGLHTVVVTDARGCTASDTVTIHQPDVLTVSISVLDSVYCNGMSTGSLKANPLGGTPFTSTSYSYTYLWDDALQASQTTQIATNLAADIYTVVVTDIRGCTAIATADITTVTNTMSLTASHTDVSCYGSLDGTASVSVTGVPPQYASYSYNWVGNNGSTLATSPSVQGLSAGTYSVTVSDVNNCTRNTSVDIVEPLPIVYNISGSDDEYCVGACDGEIFIDTLSGGTPPYSALLTNITTGITTSHSITAASILDVCSGDYTVELTNQDGCSSSVIAGGNNQALVGVVNPQLPVPSIAVTNDVSCYDGNDGAIALSGTPNVNYNYTWHDTNGNQVGTGNTANNLEAGDYYVMAQFQNLSGGSNPVYHIGPVDSATAPGGYYDGSRYLLLDCISPSKLVSAVVYAEEIKTINFQLKDSTGLVVLDDTTITVLAGEQRLYFNFDIPIGTGLQLGVNDTGNTGLFRNRETQGNVMLYPYVGSTVSITGTTTNQPLRNYYFYYDLEIEELSSNVIAGCEVVSAPLTIEEPDPISILETSHLDILCNGDNTGGLSVQVSGGTPGTPPYTYTWTPNQTTNATIANLTAGTYVLDVEDGNNCTQVDSFIISEPPAINASISQGSNIYILTALPPTGGTAPYSYSWREQSSPSSHLQGSTTYNVYAPGTYYVVVEDANGCEVQSNSFTYTSSPTSVVDVTSEIDLNIYPNPFKDETTVDFGTEVKEATITIVDVYGKLIETYNVNNQQTQVITRNNKASGVYFLEIEMEEELKTVKIVIEK